MPHKKLPAAKKRSPHDDLPSSVGLVKAVRDELRAEIRTASTEVKTELKGEMGSLRSELGVVDTSLKAEIGALRGELGAVDTSLKAEMGSLKGELGKVQTELKTEIGSVKSELYGLRGSIHRVEVLMEEQRNEDRIVMDGLKTLFDRQSRIEEDFKALARSRPTL